MTMTILAFVLQYFVALCAKIDKLDTLFADFLECVQIIVQFQVLKLSTVVN